MSGRRPAGVTSRVRRAIGPRTPWTAPNGAAIDLPVVVDILETPGAGGPPIWVVEASVGLVDSQPAVLSVRVRSVRGLDVDRLQAEFRWATPLDIVTVAMPSVLATGVDPFRYPYPVDGYPAAAQVDRAIPTRLTDEFLAMIAARYLALGRGYARKIAEERSVSPRTVVSWVERARARGILSATRRGVVGGRLREPPARPRLRPDRDP